MDIREEILNLKRELNAAILAHNYQPYEVQEIADFVGDSLELSLISTKLDAEVIVFAGVRFMAEQTKALNPNKKVLMPIPSALCSLASLVTVEMIKEYKEKYPGAPLVVYVNSPIEVKAEADYIVTSANATKLVSKLNSDTILFSPDANLAHYVAKVTGKKVIAIPPTGHCYVHLLITPYDILEAKRKYPDAIALVHPEVPPETQELADYIAGTSGMIKFVSRSDHKKFLIGTETGMLNRLRREFPDKEFYPIVPNADCIGMKKITLESIYYSLKNLVYEVVIKEEYMHKVRRALDRSFEILGV
ncbi:MAG: quinolinate synthase NadA [Crenarchaeota archaeon]|nr:quinolinate synthase NadA [Thermoproteota archaeon]